MGESRQRETVEKDDKRVNGDMRKKKIMKKLLKLRLCI